MTHFIQNIVEADELLLSWQSRKGDDSMRRFVGKLVRQGNDASFEYLRDTPDFNDAREAGFREFPGLPLEGKHGNVLPLFARRLPPRSRSDFQQYVQSFGIENSNDIDDFDLLGYSGAKLPGDDFTFIHPFTGAEPPVELWLLVAGYRYYQDGVSYDQLKIGTEVTFESAPDNPKDPDAIRLLCEDRPLGYVNRGLNKQVGYWINQGYLLTAIIERINGTPEKPIVYLYVEVRA